MTKSEIEQIAKIQEAAEMEYPDNDDTFDEYNPSLINAFIHGAKFVLDQQAKDVEELRKEFDNRFRYAAETEDEVAGMNSVWDWVSAHLNTQKEGWMSVDERLPENKNYVLAITNNGAITTSFYTKGYEVEYEDYDYQGAYDEVEDNAGTLFLKPGWYEQIEQYASEYDTIFSHRKVTHWMPLPNPPAKP